MGLILYPEDINAGTFFFFLNLANKCHEIPKNAEKKLKNAEKSAERSRKYWECRRMLENGKIQQNETLQNANSKQKTKMCQNKESKIW